MAKLIPYRPGTIRKPAFRKVKARKHQLLEEKGQLNLFNEKSDKEPIRLKQMRYLDPFEKAVAMDETDRAKARQLYLEAIEKDMFVADSWCNLGILEASDGQTIKAMDCFTKSLTKDPRHLESHYNLANMYFDAENFNLAITHYNLAIEIDPDFEEAFFNLALTNISVKDYQSAHQCLVKYIQLKRESDPDALVLLRLLKNQ